MDIRLYNSLTKKIELFTPLKPGKVKMYHCGPTVYDDVHIGNLRAFFLADIIRRVFEWNQYEVLQVMNITDVGHLSDDGDHGDDKMTRALVREKKTITLESMLEVATKYKSRFVEDLDSMNIQRPHHLPRASEHIQEDIAMIEKLAKAGHTYETDDSVYFDTQSYPDYGQLGLAPLDDNHSRTGIDQDKKSPRDFALWKKNNNLGWESPWGKGFPGWHIECSGMSTKFLGNHFDIHTGGIDLLPTHHNNEIAQSVCSTEEPFVNYWLHNEHLGLKNTKMSKSTGNSITLRTLAKEGFSGLDYRYWLLQSSYRSQVDFSLENLTAAKTARERLQKHATAESLAEIPDASPYWQKFTDAINNDLGTPEALGIAWEVAKDKKLSDNFRSSLLLKFDEVLGVFENDQEAEALEIPEIVLSLAEEREEARATGDWDQADFLRTEIRTYGYTIADGPDGTTFEKI